MANRGRPTKYDTHIKPYLDEIPEMRKFMTQNQIARELGVTPGSLINYAKRHPELKEALKDGNRKFVLELKNALYKKALGYTATDTKKTVRDDGSWEEVTTEKHIPPDIGAINLLLKNLDKDNWANDPQNLAVRKEELELKREIAGKEQSVIPVQIINDIPRPSEVSENDGSN